MDAQDIEKDFESAVTEQTEAVKAAVLEPTQAAKVAAGGMSDNLRALVEKGLHETRARYAKTKGVVEQTSTALETSFGAARDGVAQLNVKAIEALKADADAHFEHLKSLASVKSFSDVITLNTEFVRKRFENATARAKSFSEAARTVAEAAGAPIRAQIAKTTKLAS